MKKICFLVEYLSYKGGGERVYTNMANTFVKKGYDVTIVSIENTNKLAYSLDERVKIKSLKLRPEYYYKNKFRKIFDIIYFFKYIAKINKVIKEYDTIISIGANVNILLSYIKDKKSIKIGTEHIGFDSVNIMVKLMRKIRYKKLDKLVVLTDTDKNKFIKKFKKLEIKTIPNQISFKIKEKKDQNKNTIINVASLSYQKNQERLINLFSKIEKKYPEWKLEIYGEGPLRKELEKKIIDLKLEEKVYLMGNSNFIEEKLLKSDVFCFTSRYEGFPMVLLEAMECGLPVISFDCPTGPREIIENNNTGYLIENDDDNDYIFKLEKLMQNKELRMEMGKKAKKNVRKYSENKVFSLWEKIL